MKIVIDIHDIPQNDHERWVLKNGTPLSEDATNGDIFKAMFSNLTIYENRDNKDYPYVDVIIGEHDSTCYPKDWWDEQYKKGEKDADSN